MSSFVGPIKPRFAFSVGITGHRPNRGVKQDAGPNADHLRGLPPQDLARILETVLGEIRQSVFCAAEKALTVLPFSNNRQKPASTCVSLVSCLAEGSDRIAARSALRQGYLLEALLPFPVDEYERDFEAVDSRAEFRDLLRCLGSVSQDVGGQSTQPGVPLELPGDRANSNKAYDMANRAMLDHVSLLIAVWDGKPAAGRGGTETVVAEAVRRGMPVVVINADGAGAEPRLYWGGFGDCPVYPNHIADLTPVPVAEAMPEVIDALIRPPMNGERANLQDYLAEKLRKWNLCLHWPVLLGLFGVKRPSASDIKAPKFEETAARIAADTGVQNGKLAGAYSWADALGSFYAQIFRSAFVLNFALASLAVAVVAVSILLKDALHLAYVKWPFVVVEILLIGLLILNTWMGRRYNWHRRWLETREVAERLRIALAMRRLATRPIMASGSTPTWTSWYVRAILRESGLPTGAITVEDLHIRRGQLRQMLNAQRDYHDTSGERMHKLEHRMEKTGEFLFFATLAVAAAFVSMVFALGGEHHIAPIWKYTVTALTAGLPVLATATYGIRVIGDFEGNAKRSHRMAAELERLIAAIDNDDPNDLFLAQARAHQASAIMLGDLASWRSSAESRELAIPG